MLIHICDFGVEVLYQISFLLDISFGSYLYRVHNYTHILTDFRLTDLFESWHTTILVKRSFPILKPYRSCPDSKTRDFGVKFEFLAELCTKRYYFWHNLHYVLPSKINCDKKKIVSSSSRQS